MCLKAPGWDGPTVYRGDRQLPTFTTQPAQTWPWLVQTGNAENVKKLSQSMKQMHLNRHVRSIKTSSIHLSITLSVIIHPPIPLSISPLSIHPSSLIHLPIYLSIHPSIYIIHPRIHACMHPSIFLPPFHSSSIHPLIHPFLYPPTYPSIHYLFNLQKQNMIAQMLLWPENIDVRYRKVSGEPAPTVLVLCSTWCWWRRLKSFKSPQWV